MGLGLGLTLAAVLALGKGGAASAVHRGRSSAGRHWAYIPMGDLEPAH